MVMDMVMDMVMEIWEANQQQQQQQLPRRQRLAWIRPVGLIQLILV
jgi:hypothetical protein